VLALMKNQLVSRRISKKKPSKLSSGRDSVRARTSSGCPKLAGKPSAPSLVVDQGMNSMEVREEGKRIRVNVVD
jgi:hypothetical protein